jgi:hypothetical protein
MDRRKLYRMEPHREMANSPPSAKPAPSSTPKDLPPAFRTTAPFNSGGLEQKVEELTRKFAALSAGKMVPPHLSGSTPYQSSPPAPRNPEFKCYYCFLNNHGTKKCNSLLYDESIGAVSRDGRDFKLPDSTTIPWDISRPIKQVVDQFARNSVNISSSFGQLQEVETEEVGAYEVDLGKRTRSSKEEDMPASDKRTRKEKDTLMDMDEEDLLKMANPSNPSNSSKPNSAPPPSSPKSSSQPNKVRFQESSGQEPPKEKPAKKTYLEKTLAKEYPGVEEETAKRMLMGGKLELSFGEIFAISSGVTDCFKKRISNKRVPVEEAISTHSGALDETEGEEDSITHYSCPLGYINLSVKGHEYQALLDTGSMVNLIPLGLAQHLGLVITERTMNLTGIGGHSTGIIGIAEDVEVLVGKVTRPVHFWVAKGPVQIIVGKPFLMDVSATIRYNGSREESLSILDPKGKTYLVPILLPSHHKKETTLPVHIVTRDFLGKPQDFNFSK